MEIHKERTMPNTKYPLITWRLAGAIAIALTIGFISGAGYGIAFIAGAGYWSFKKAQPLEGILSLK